MTAIFKKFYETPCSQPVELRMRGFLCFSDPEGQTEGENYTPREEKVW
jgi:hypothetical protein